MRKIVSLLTKFSNDVNTAMLSYTRMFSHKLHVRSKLLQVQKRAVYKLSYFSPRGLGESARTPILQIFLREVNSLALCIPSVPRRMLVGEVE